MKSARNKLKKTSSHRKEKGKSNKVLLVALALIIVAVIGGGYLLTQKTGVSIPGVKAPLNANCEHNDPELCKFLNNWATTRDSSVITKSNFGGMTIESTYESSGSEKYHMTSKMNGKENSNVITIGESTYTLDYSDNKWWKSTYKVEDVESEERDSPEMQETLDFDEIKDTTTYQFIAKEPCSGLTCFKYEMVSQDSENTKQYIWFDDKEYLMRKMLIEDSENGSSESVYNYENVSINVPSPVKEGTPSDTTGANGYSEEDVKKMMQQYQQSYEEESPEMPAMEEYSEEY